ncbi:MAG: RsiV family protein [Marinirhabdus sp.]
MFTARHFVIVLLLICAGCSRGALTTAQVTVTENGLPECQTVACPAINVQYIVYGGNGEVAGILNREIESFIINTLQLDGGTGQSTEGQTVTGAASGFVESYTQRAAAYPDLAVAYEVTVSVSEIYRAPALRCLKMEQWSYTGGAHGYGSTGFENFDPRTGTRVTTAMLLRDSAGFTAYAEKKLKETYGIPQGENINAKGFWFKEGAFHLPGTLGITAEKIIVHYNPYDVAGYADGPIQVSIPINEVAHFFNRPVGKK